MFLRQFTNYRTSLFSIKIALLSEKTKNEPKNGQICGFILRGPLIIKIYLFMTKILKK